MDLWDQKGYYIYSLNVPILNALKILSMSYYIKWFYRINAVMKNTHRQTCVLTNPAAYMGTITGCFLLPVKSYTHVLGERTYI